MLNCEGMESVTAPVLAEAVIWFAVPVSEVTPLADVRYVLVSTERLPDESVFTKPAVARLESVAMFCEVLTVNAPFV